MYPHIVYVRRTIYIGVLERSASPRPCGEHLTVSTCFICLSKGRLTATSSVMFWHVVDSNLQERLANAERCRENLSKRDGSPEDFRLIEESILQLLVCSL